MKKGDKLIYLYDKFEPKYVIAYYLFKGESNFHPYHEEIITTNANLVDLLQSHEEAIKYYNSNLENRSEIIFVYNRKYLYNYNEKELRKIIKKINYYNSRRSTLISDHHFYYEIGELILENSIDLKKIKIQYKMKLFSYLSLKIKKNFLKPIFGIFFYDLLNLFRWYKEFYEVEDKVNQLESSIKNIDNEMWIHTQGRDKVITDYKNELVTSKQEFEKKESQILTANKNLLSLTMTFTAIIVSVLSFVINSWINENRRLELQQTLVNERIESKKVKEENKTLIEKIQAYEIKIQELSKIKK